jgi:SAM-dependent methyltransferase
MMVDPRDVMLQRLLVDAGISASMRVLDLGCGYGKVSAMLSRIVGPSGSVTGVDRDPSAIEVAKRSAASQGLTNTRFQVTSIESLAESSLKGPFDAAVARRVFMYVPDPVAALLAVKGQVRAGGVVVLQEQDTSMVPVASAPLPLHRRVHEWVWTMVEREGANVRFGLALPSVFARAGLSLEELRVEAVAQTASRRLPTADMVRAVMPRIVAQGVATEAEIDVDTLDQRLEAELTESGASFVGDVVFGAWGRVS